MNHIDEHIIELFVLRSPTVESRRGGIERHLAECHGCRTLAVGIERFYATVDTTLRESPGERPVGETALLRSPRSLEPYYEPYSPLAPRRPSGLGGRIRYYVRRYPIATGVGGFAMAAALAGIVLLRPGTVTTPSDVNPAYTRINPTAGTVEIYNRGNQKIRELPSKMLFHATPDVIAKEERRFQVTDIDGDGRKELIAGMALGAQRTDAMPLTIYEDDGRIRLERYFTNPLEWNGVQYADSQSVEAFTLSGAEGSPGRDIYVVANNIRSPNTLYRLSGAGDILAEYNHFGAAYPSVVRMPGTTKEYLLFHGQNDTREPDSLSYPVMIVLDPSRLEGRTEAGDSRGFGLPASAAEEYIIRFPLTDINRAFLSQGYVSSVSVITQNNQPRIHVVVGGTYSLPEIMLFRGPGFQFYLDADFRVVEVKYDSPTMKLRQRMIAEGRMEDVPVDDFLAGLRDAVLYWNGAGWQHEPTRVKGRPDA